ncbi:MAG: MBL fold metallo-hydrolase [Candidatus Eisenbacteria bacterium]|uniref:MBL fold metallo-hydrolase n=1 Tax=Eiseniibacteriota bacterium TaxID=2212470 RepID=A0A849SIX2_UNCEI|nr:MBL fold metallo-hydrolase [Candidatus Eisenbacteria bacterium]
MATSLRIRFEGAARTVTGSRHHLFWGERSGLFDCGLFQGPRDEAERINRNFAFEPSQLDAMVVSHAHLDHTGNLPTLVAGGYGGRIHMTPATADLSRFMLADSAFLQEKDVEHVNKHARGRPPRRPLYTPADVEATLERIDTHEYHAPWELWPGATVEYFDAGHILGSAITTYTFEQNGRQFRLAMGGDLGRANRPILQDPEQLQGIDALVLESTYGNRVHQDTAETERQLIEIVERTVQRGGRVLVPSFAVGRAQDFVATLHKLCERGEVCEVPIFVDSPMARSATGVFVRHPELFDAETRHLFEHERGAPFGFARLRYVSSPDESRALNDRREPCIIVAASGMCEGGRILHHLLHGLGNPRNTVLFVGFQAQGTLGRRIKDGVEKVNVFGEPIQVHAEVAALDGFSAHADQNELVAWVTAIKPTPRNIFLVHGELEAAEALAARLKEHLPTQVHIPEKGQEFDLWT